MPTKGTLKIGISVCCLLVGVAFAAKVKADYDRSANFTVYKTYAWGKNLEPQRPHANIVLRGAVDYELQARGLRLVGSVEDADLVVRYQVAGDSDMNFGTLVDPTFAMVGGVPWPGATAWYPGFSMSSNGRYIRKGAMVLDIFDRLQKKLIFSATATGALDPGAKKAIEQVNKVVTDIFSYYPVKNKDQH